MKRSILLFFLLVICQLSFTQTPYKYVIIPTYFPEIGKGINPYGISGDIQRILNEKSIKSVFELDERPDDFCDALTVALTKSSSMLKSKLIVEFRDCKNKTVWSKEGAGISKDFVSGYNEALVNALSELQALPSNTISNLKAVNTNVNIPVVKETNTEIYKPQNLFFNYTFFVDLMNGENGEKMIKIINGELLGYKNLQDIATLTPSGVDDTSYLVKWTTPKGETIHGVAKLTGNHLNISLSSGESPLIISLLKY